MIEIGIDEAGRGPVIGPLVVCSVAIPKSDIGLLVEIGVKDSKDLTAKKILLRTITTCAFRKVIVRRRETHKALISSKS